VASHAQKYFIRLNSMKKDRKRASIHDITAPQQQLQQIKAQVRWLAPPRSPAPPRPLPLPRRPAAAPARRPSARSGAALAPADPPPAAAACVQVRQQQQAAKQQKEAALLARQRAQATRQAQQRAEHERAEQQQALEAQQQQQEQEQQAQLASPFAVPSMQQALGWELPGVVPTMVMGAQPPRAPSHPCPDRCRPRPAPLLPSQYISVAAAYV
jgi:uncharacterized membrane protein YqiK